MEEFLSQEYIIRFSLIVAFAFIVMPNLKKENFLSRLICSSIVVFLAFEYMLWRLISTAWPAPMPTLQGFWIWICLFVEVIVFIETGIFYLTITRSVDRKKEADKYEGFLKNSNKNDLPSVDVFLPTYNEGLDVLERSIISSLAIDWPNDKLNVYVLDDGKRDWLKKYCLEKGVNYLTRPDNNHAKAGNLNNAFSHTKGDFIAIFDADFCPFKNFLYRTIGFFNDPTVSIVQTPQNFFNRDFLQSNLHMHNKVLDDQRLFFDIMMPARDGWDVSFWCGSCSVTRRKCMEITGGIPTHSVTEDLLTTLVLLRYGYKTRYLNEKLSHGLAPENLKGLNLQRKRWCRGTLQSLYSSDGPLGKGLSLIQRIMFFPIAWLFSPFIRVMTLVIPLVYMWFGVESLIINHYMDLVTRLLPLQAMNFLVMWWYMPKHFVPFLNSAVNTLNAIQVIPTIISSIINPHKNHFAVTPKGKDHINKIKIHKISFIFSSTFLILTALGIYINVFTDMRNISESGFFPIASFWASVNIITLSIMIFLSIEHPRKRGQERFPSNKNIKISFLKNGIKYNCILMDISIEGAKIKLLKNTKIDKIEICNIYIDDMKPLNCQIKNKEFSGYLYLNFYNVSGEQRDDLIRYIFTGDFDNKIYDVSHWIVLKSFIKRCFGRNLHSYSKK